MWSWNSQRRLEFFSTEALDPPIKSIAIFVTLGWDSRRVCTAWMIFMIMLSKRNFHEIHSRLPEISWILFTTRRFSTNFCDEHIAKIQKSSVSTREIMSMATKKCTKKSKKHIFLAIAKRVDHLMRRSDVWRYGSNRRCLSRCGTDFGFVRRKGSSPGLCVRNAFATQ